MALLNECHIMLGFLNSKSQGVKVKIIALIAIIFISGCASKVSKNSEGRYVWNSPELDVAVNEGKVSQHKTLKKLGVDEDRCQWTVSTTLKMSLSCKEPPEYDCSNFVTKDVQEIIMTQCMNDKGWLKVWVHFDSYAGLNNSTERVSEKRIDTLVRESKTLSSWRRNQPVIWALAKQVDDGFRYNSGREMSIEERLAALPQAVRITIVNKYNKAVAVRNVKQQKLAAQVLIRTYPEVHEWIKEGGDKATSFHSNLMNGTGIRGNVPLSMIDKIEMAIDSVNREF